MPRIATAALLALLAGALGCNLRTGGKTGSGTGTAAPAPQPAGNQLGGTLGPAPAGGSTTVLGKSRDRAVDTQIGNDLKNLYLAYTQHETLEGQGPAGVADLGNSIGARMRDMIMGGDVVVYWKVKFANLTQGTSATVLAYEKRVEKSEGMVLTADGGVHRKTAEQFGQMAKAGR
jgi:hypothetical protein